MKTIAYAIIMASYLVPQALRIISLADPPDAVLLGAAIASFILFATSGYLTWRKVPYCRFITSGYLAFAGLFMLPWFVAPSMNSIWLRLALGSTGVIWTAASIWIFRNFPAAAK